MEVSNRVGGAERSLQLLIKSLHALGWRCALASSRDVSACPSRRTDTIELYRLRSFQPTRYPRWRQAVCMAGSWMAGMLQLLQIIRRTRPQIIHANTTSAMLVALLPALLAKVPIVWHVRDLVPLGWLGRLGGRAAAAVLCVSDAVRMALIKEGLPPEKMQVIYNGVGPAPTRSPNAVLARQRLTAMTGLPSNAFVYANIGQFVSWKRQGDFLDAAAIVAAQDTEAGFLLAGAIPGHTDNYVASLRERASRPDLAGRTAILEWQADIESVLSACNVLVHTATAEPFGRVLIEAMNAGLPVVAVRAGGPAEIVQADISGLLAEPGDLAGLARLMLRVKRDRSLAKRLSSAGWQRVDQNFRAHHTATKVDFVYRHIQRSGAWIADRN
ncbi:MAG TPA: glycosyltransferase family 4 protein [Phycisphaerae bacterium]|nr:glycosyltransferase family 4 protein [Phycisphaerae bacterium]